MPHRSDNDTFFTINVVGKRPSIAPPLEARANATLGRFCFWAAFFVGAQGASFNLREIMKNFYQKILAGALLCRYSDLPMMLHTPEGNPGSGGGAGGGGGNSGQQRENTADVAGRFNGDAARHANRISDVEHDNFQYREKLRDRDARIKELEGKVPASESVILTKEQAAQWDAYQKLGAPDVVTKDLESGRAAITKNSARDKAETLEAAAKSVGFKPGLLKLLAPTLDVQMREVEVENDEGQKSKVQRPFVVTKDGDNEKVVGLVEHFKAQGDDVLATLQAQDSGEAPDDTRGHDGGGGVNYPAQNAGNNGAANKTEPYAQSYVANRYGHNRKPTEK